MVPPTQALNLDIAAVSGICGSISIACWVVVFSPQILENFRRGSADGLSLQFIIVWLVGDVFNILGAVMQGVLPTMIILALYYTIADIVLLGQCFYYRGFTFRDEVVSPAKPPASTSAISDSIQSNGLRSPALTDRNHRWSGEHLSPVVPLHIPSQSTSAASPPQPPTTRLQATLFNIFAIFMVCLAGVLGWYFSTGSQRHSHRHRHHSYPADESLTFSTWGQVFGYLCALLYLFSRLPQILLNYRRKSTEGVSMLFFLFACIANLTYVLSILAYSPACATTQMQTSVHHCDKQEALRLYARYIAINASWLVGSAGTLVLDFGIFCQFFYYREQDIDFEDDESQRPLLG